MSRPKIHESPNERLKGFRAKTSRHDFTTTPEIGETLNEIAAHLDTTKNALLNSMIRFALTNHNWKQSGVWSMKK